MRPHLQFLFRRSNSTGLSPQGHTFIFVSVSGETKFLKLALRTLAQVALVPLSHGQICVSEEEGERQPSRPEREGTGTRRCRELPTLSSSPKFYAASSSFWLADRPAAWPIPTHPRASPGNPGACFTMC